MDVGGDVEAQLPTGGAPTPDVGTRKENHIAEAAESGDRRPRGQPDSKQLTGGVPKRFIHVSNSIRLQASNNELKEKLEALEKRFTQMDSKNVKLRARNTLLEKEKEELTAKFECLTIETNNLSIGTTELY